MNYPRFQELSFLWQHTKNKNKHTIYKRPRAVALPLWNRFLIPKSLETHNRLRGFLYVPISPGMLERNGKVLNVQLSSQKYKSSHWMTRFTHKDNSQSLYIWKLIQEDNWQSLHVWKFTHEDNSQSLHIWKSWVKCHCC